VVRNNAKVGLLSEIAHKRFYAIFPTALLCSLSIHAQQPALASPGPATMASPEARMGSEIKPGSEPTALPSQIAPKNDRLFFVLPNYLSVEHLEPSEPLSAGMKFKLSVRTMSDPVTVSFVGMIALMGQARNSDPSYGQGFAGYAKRYATVYADTGISTLMTASVFPALLHQDPRYFQLGHGGVWHRTRYSVSRIFLTRGDDGSRQFNYSELVGTAVAAGVSNAYHPAYQRTVGNTVGVWGTDLALNALCNVAKEFWPDIRRKTRKQKAN
jgi:hypothetical protein